MNLKLILEENLFEYGWILKTNVLKKGHNKLADEKILGWKTLVSSGEETEINLRQFSRKVEIKGFNRERIEKGCRCFIRLSFIKKQFIHKKQEISFIKT